MTKTEFLRDLKTPQHLVITHCSNPSMNKTGNPYFTALKTQTLKVFINFNYDDIVNDFMPEGFKEYRAGQRIWGQRVPGTPLVINKGTFYLETIVVEEIGTPTFRMPDGAEIDPDKIKPFLKSKTPDDKGEFVKRRDFKIDDIQSVQLENDTVVRF